MGGSLRAGDEFAGYEIVQSLGAGGMGAVYKARDRDLPRFVALKLLTVPGGGGAEHHVRFRREADAVARLDHPNIVTVYARGQVDDQLWIAMTYVDGDDVSVVLRGGALNPGRAVRIISETAGALDHAHAAGILHRDVKPANILLTRGQPERVLLTDFGIAKTLDESQQLTGIGEVLASFHYAAPERWTGPGDADHRADVYSLGCTLYHMLTGQLPFPGQSVGQLLYNHAYGDVPQPSRHVPTLPRGFDEVIARALHKDPEHRYQNCTQLARAALQSLREPSHPRHRTQPPTELLGGPPSDPKNPPRQPHPGPSTHTGTTSHPGGITPPPGGSARPATDPRSQPTLPQPTGHHTSGPQFTGATAHPPRQGPPPTGFAARPNEARQFTGAATSANQQGAQRAMPAESANRQGAASGPASTRASRPGPPHTTAVNQQGALPTGAAHPNEQRSGAPAHPNPQGQRSSGAVAHPNRQGTHPAASGAGPVAPAAGQTSGPQRRPLPPTRQLPQLDREPPRAEPAPSTPDAPPTLLDTGSAWEPPGGHVPPPPTRRKRSRPVWIPLLVAVLTVVVALVYLQSRRDGSPAQTLPTTPSVVTTTAEPTTTTDDVLTTTAQPTTSTTYRVTTTTTTTSVKPVTTPVPNVVGQLIAAAKAKLESAGFVVVTVDREDSSAKGTVLSLDPAAGTQRAPGSKITAYVSTGTTTTTITMPNLVGHTVAQATAAMKAAGWTGSLHTTTKKVTDATQADKVIAQSVTSGTAITPDAPVTVTVGESATPTT
ncbi:protein kinase domain-containing protein [Nocardia sp. NPDC003693]